jgi:hypothetical protein
MEFSGGQHLIDAPLGCPPVFIRSALVGTLEAVFPVG